MAALRIIDENGDVTEIQNVRNELLLPSSGGGTSFRTDKTLKLENGVLSVNTADVVEEDNTLPITSAAVAIQVGNIELILKTI